jgi:O-antigen/teichoic acid export membrane protein
LGYRFDFTFYSVNVDISYTTSKKLIRALTNRLQTLGASRELIILLGSQGLTAIAGLLYGKLITEFVTPAEFGHYSVQYVALLLFIAIFVSPTVQAFMSASQQQGVQVIMPAYTRLFFVLAGGSFLVVSVLYMLKVANVWVFAAWLSGVFQYMFALSQGLLLAMGRLKTYALLQGLNPLLNLLLLLVVVFVVKEPTAIGLWVNVLLLNGLLFIIAAWLAQCSDPAFRPVFGRFDTATSRPVFTNYITFVVPLLGYAVFSSLNNYADRYFIGYLLTVASVGFYTTAYSLGSRLGVVGNPFVNHLNALMFTARRENRHQDTNPLILQHLIMFWGIGLPVCLMLYVFQNEIGHLLLSPRYQPAFQLIPVIGLAYVLLHSIQFFEVKFIVYEKTWYLMIHSVIGTIINFSFNWLLIPTLGILGAALATLASFFIQLIVVVLLNKFY